MGLPAASEVGGQDNGDPSHALGLLTHGSASRPDHWRQPPSKVEAKGTQYE